MRWRRVGPASAALCLVALASAAVSPGARAQDDPPPVSAARDVMPFFRDKCLGCHAGAQPKKNLSLETKAKVLKGGDQGPIIVPKKSGESLLYLYLSGQRQPKMPPNERLDDSRIEMIRRWIDAGANWDLPAGN